MQIIANPFAEIARGRVFQLHGGPHAGSRVVFQESPPDTFHADGAVYARTSCGYKVTPFVDPIAVAKSRRTAPHLDPDAD